MTDKELAEEIEKVIIAGNKVGIPLASIIKMGFTSQQWNEIIAALRRGQWREVEPGRIFYAWLFDDGSFDWELHAVEKYAREAADAEERADPPDKIKVIPVRVVHAESATERPPSGEMVMGLRVVVNPDVPADEVWITDAHGKRLGTIVNLSAAEAEVHTP
jgi:hypothetical protein